MNKTKEENFIQEVDSGTFVLAEVDKILEQIADSHIFLHFMLHSKHGQEMRPAAKVWDGTLNQVG